MTAEIGVSDKFTPPLSHLFERREFVIEHGDMSEKSPIKKL
jgi:hypothetical protein